MGKKGVQATATIISMDVEQRHQPEEQESPHEWSKILARLNLFAPLRFLLPDCRHLKVIWKQKKVFSQLTIPWSSSSFDHLKPTTLFIPHSSCLGSKELSKFLLYTKIFRFLMKTLWYVSEESMMH